MTIRQRLLLVVGVALLLRLVYVTADVPVPDQDTPDYDEIAHNLLAGQGFVATSNWFDHELRAWRAPVYPFFLAAIYAVHDSHTAVRVVQALIGALTVALVYGLALRLMPAAAFPAAWVTALYEPLLTNTNEVMTETLFTALLVAGVNLALAARGREGHRWPLAAGFVLGLATLTRPVGLLAVIAIAGVILWEDRRGWRKPRSWLPVVWLTLGVGAAILPWTVRNAVVLEALVPVSTHGGFILARSNADNPDWRREHGWRISADTFAQQPDEVERDRAWRRQGLSWIADNPGAWLLLAGERLLRLFYMFRPEYNSAFVVLLPLTLLGIWWRGGAPGFRYLTAVCGLSIATFSLILYGSTRFRLPLEPFFILFAVVAAVLAWQRWGHRFAVVAVAWGMANVGVRLFDEPVRAAVVSMLQAGGLK